MAKPKWQVPFAGKKPCFWVGVSRYEPLSDQDDDDEGVLRCLIPGEEFEVRRKVTWRDNFEFTTTMTVTGMESGSWSAKHCTVQDSDGIKYVMFVVDLVDALRNFACVPASDGSGGQLTGRFTFCKRGQNYGVKMVGAVGTSLLTRE